MTIRITTILILSSMASILLVILPYCNLKPGVSLITGNWVAVFIRAVVVSTILDIYLPIAHINKWFSLDLLRPSSQTTTDRTDGSGANISMEVMKKVEPSKDEVAGGV